MPSSLLYKAFEINQFLNNIQFSKFPIHWMSNKKNFEYGSEKEWKTYLLRALKWKVFIFSPIVSFALYCMIIRNPELFTAQHMFRAVLQFLIIWSTLFADLLLFAYGKEITSCCNWCFEIDNALRTNMYYKMEIFKNTSTTRFTKISTNYKNGKTSKQKSITRFQNFIIVFIF